MTRDAAVLETLQLLDGERHNREEDGKKSSNKKQLIRSEPEREGGREGGRCGGAPLDGAAGSGGSGHANWSKGVDRLA